MFNILIELLRQST